MLIRSRPLNDNRAISPVTNRWVAIVASIIAIVLFAMGAFNYALHSAAFLIVYTCLILVARHQTANPSPSISSLPERPWATVPASVCIALTWGVILISLHFFMVETMYPRFMHELVRSPTNSVLTIRNTELLISTLLCIYVLLDYARLASAVRSNLGHRTIATALGLEFLLVTHFAVL